VAILSRGYKRSTKGFRLVEINSRFCDCGDEALLIKRNFPETIVAVCEERCEGVEKLLELFPNLDAIILDDGFQHRKLTPSISIILNNYYRMFQHDFYLPYGRLRDCKSTYKRADYIIFTKCPENLSESQKTQLIEQSKVLPNQKILFSSIRYKNLQNVYEKTVQIALSELKDYNILLVTGIAESRNLVDFLETKTALVKHLRFSDHHNFSTKDISNILSEYERLYNPKIVVITEKDAIKFAELYVHDEFKNHIFYIPIEIEIL
jgi:tetraacyldisaccharide 4'-kinase